MRKKYFLTGIPLVVLGALAVLAGNWGCGSNNSAAAPVTLTQSVTIVATPASSGSPGRDWTFTTLAAPFPARYYHMGVVFNNRMWVMGGQTNSARLNDVWSSPDGATWTQALADNASPGPNQYSRRSGAGSVTLNNKMWIIAGANPGNLNDVWSSPDGVSWTNVLVDTASPGPNQFPRRSGHACVAFNNQMWVIGGFTSAYANDVWSSSDGVSWNNVLANNASPGPNQFPARTGHACVAYNNKLWVMGGSNGAGLNDVWSSSDGVSWTNVLASNASPGPNQFSTRNTFPLVVYGNGMWILGGYGTGGPLNDVWYSIDGYNWTQMTASAAFAARYAHSGLVFNNDLWVIAGAGNGSIRGDVWHSPL